MTVSVPVSGKFPARVDLIIFDCDGVLIDSEYLACSSIVETFACYGVTVPIDLLLSRLTGVTDKSLPDQLEAMGYAIPDAAYRRLEAGILEKFRTALMPTAEMATLLEDLAVRICVASNSSVKRLDVSLGVTDLARFFGANVFSADHVARGKPDPALFLHAAERMSVPPENCLIVEDSSHGLAAARAAGIAALGFHGGSHCRPDHGEVLLRSGALATFARAGDLKRFLSKYVTASTEPV